MQQLAWWVAPRSLTASELHWLDVPECVKYKLGMITRRCLNGTALWCLAAHCIPVFVAASRWQHLHSTASLQLVVPSYDQVLMVVGPSLLLARWCCTHCQDIGMTQFTPPPSLSDCLKPFSFQSTNIYSALGAVRQLMRYINWCFTYILTHCVTGYIIAHGLDVSQLIWSYWCLCIWVFLWPKKCYLVFVQSLLAVGKAAALNSFSGCQ